MSDEQDQALLKEFEDLIREVSKSSVQGGLDMLSRSLQQFPDSVQAAGSQIVDRSMRELSEQLTQFSGRTATLTKDIVRNSVGPLEEGITARFRVLDERLKEYMNDLQSKAQTQNQVRYNGILDRLAAIERETQSSYAAQRKTIRKTFWGLTLIALLLAASLAYLHLRFG